VRSNSANKDGSGGDASGASGASGGASGGIADDNKEDDAADEKDNTINKGHMHFLRSTVIDRISRAGAIQKRTKNKKKVTTCSKRRSSSSASELSERATPRRNSITSNAAKGSLTEIFNSPLPLSPLLGSLRRRINSNPDNKTPYFTPGTPNNERLRRAEYIEMQPEPIVVIHNAFDASGTSAAAGSDPSDPSDPSDLLLEDGLV